MTKGIGSRLCTRAPLLVEHRALRGSFDSLRRIRCLFLILCHFCLDRDDTNGSAQFVIHGALVAVQRPTLTCDVTAQGTLNLAVLGFHVLVLHCETVRVQRDATQTWEGSPQSNAHLLTCLVHDGPFDCLALWLLDEILPRTCDGRLSLGIGIVPSRRCSHQPLYWRCQWQKSTLVPIL